MKNFLMYNLNQQCDFKRGRHHGYLNVFALIGRRVHNNKVAAFIETAQRRHDDDRRGDSESYLYGVITGAEEAVKAFDSDDVEYHATLDFMVPRLRELERESREAIEVCEMVDNLIPLPLEVST